MSELIIRIYYIYKKKLKKKQWNCKSERMSKATEENELAVTIKRLL